MAEVVLLLAVVAAPLLIGAACVRLGRPWWWGALLAIALFWIAAITPEPEEGESRVALGDLGFLLVVSLAVAGLTWLGAWLMRRFGRRLAACETVATVSDLVQLASRLVAIESINPGVVAGGSGELGVARFVAEWCERAGLETTLTELRPTRANVVAVARGAGGGRSLMLNAHMDTVGVAGMSEPFEPRLEGGRLFGRGAQDMKGSLAACMLVAAEARSRGLRGDVILTAVADEELASIGTEAVAASLTADAAIVTEPTELRLAVAHRGFVHLEVEVEGRAAHGSRPDLGIDAIAKMGRVLVGIEELDRRLRSSPTHPHLGSGSVHASLIEGGQEFSSYPARCVLQAERRTVPGESAALAEQELREIVDRAGEGDPDFSARVCAPISREPFEVPEHAEIVHLVRRHATAVLGSEPDVVGAPFWADSALLAAAGIPTVVFGPVGEGLHSEVEWVDVASLEQCLAIYAAVAAELCA